MHLVADSKKCSGCRSCLVACSLNLFNENNPKLAAINLIPHFPDPGVYEVKVCSQCGECALVCPVGAIKKDELGTYYVQFDECIQCEACVPVCPENVMFFKADLAASAWKCNLCGDCVKVCGTDVLSIVE